MFDPFDALGDVFDENPVNYIWFFPMSLILSISIGVAWNMLEERFYKKAQEDSKWEKVEKFGGYLAIVAYCSRIIAIIVFFGLFFIKRV